MWYVAYIYILNTLNILKIIFLVIYRFQLSFLFPNILDKLFSLISVDMFKNSGWKGLTSLKHHQQQTRIFPVASNIGDRILVVYLEVSSIFHYINYICVNNCVNISFSIMLVRNCALFGIT